LALWEFHIQRANIPPKYRDKDFKDFVEQNQLAYQKVTDYCKHLKSAKSKGIGIYFVGPSGTGKTLLACSILKEAVRQGYTGYFGFLSSIIVTINDEFFRKKSGDTFGRIKTCDFLVIDEIEKIYKSDSGYVDALFDELIRTRDFDNLPVIMTSNVTMDRLESVHGKSVCSMLTEKLIEIPLVGPDFRKLIATTLEGELKS